MKLSAVIPVIVVLALSGCSYEAPKDQEKASSSSDAVAPVVNKTLTAEENSQLDAGGIKISVAGSSFKILPAVVTEKDGTSNSDDLGKHIRMAIDTSSLEDKCVDDSYHLDGQPSVEGTKATDGFEEGHCGPEFLATATRARDTRWRTGGNTISVDGKLDQGRNVIEFDAISGGFISGSITTQNAIVTFDAVTGEVLTYKEFPLDTLNPYVLPGALPSEEDIVSMKPQYVDADGTLAVGKATVTQGEHSRSVLTIPVLSNSTKEYCSFSEPLQCTDFQVVTNKTRADSNERRDTLLFSIPKKYKGEISVSSEDFDEAYIEVGSRNTEERTRINLLTGETKVVNVNEE